MAPPPYLKLLAVLLCSSAGAGFLPPTPLEVRDLYRLLGDPPSRDLHPDALRRDFGSPASLAASVAKLGNAAPLSDAQMSALRAWAQRFMAGEGAGTGSRDAVPSVEPGVAEVELQPWMCVAWRARGARGAAAPAPPLQLTRAPPPSN